MRFVRFLAILLSVCVAGLAGCNIVESKGEEVLTLYVDSHTVDCVGMVPQQCLLVKEHPTDEWSYFYDAIEGFTYEPGYTYTLRVAWRSIDNPPADGSSRVYRLLRVLSKVPVQP